MFPATAERRRGSSSDLEPARVSCNFYRRKTKAPGLRQAAKVNSCFNKGGRWIVPCPVTPGRESTGSRARRVKGRLITARFFTPSDATGDEIHKFTPRVLAPLALHAST